MRFAVVCGTIALLTAPMPARGFEPTPEQWEQLRTGAILGEAVRAESGHLGGQTVFLLAASRETIWHALNDYDHFTEVFEGVDSVRVVAQDSVHTDVEVWTQHMLFRQFHYTLRRTVGRHQHHLTWTRLSGDFAVNEGSWEIRDTEAPGTHLLVHRTFVRINRLLPEGFTSHFTVKKMTLSDVKLRSWVVRQVAQNATGEQTE